MTKKPGNSLKNVAKVHTSTGMICSGVIYSYITTCLIFIILSIILTFTSFPDMYISTVITTTSIVSVIIAGGMAARNAKSKGWFYGSFAGFSYIFTLFLISSIVFKNFSVNKPILMMMLGGIILGACGGIIGINIGTSRKKQKK